MMFCLIAVNTNTVYDTVPELLQNWLAPEDGEAVGVSLAHAQRYGRRMEAVHAEMATLPRCAQHGTVSMFYWIVCEVFGSCV